MYILTYYTPIGYDSAVILIVLIWNFYMVRILYMNIELWLLAL